MPCTLNMNRKDISLNYLVFLLEARTVENSVKKAPKETNAASMNKGGGGKINKPCKFFQEGRCTRGNDCKYLHTKSSGGGGGGKSGGN